MSPRTSATCVSPSSGLSNAWTWKCPNSVGRRASATLLHQPLGPHAVVDEVRDGDQQQAVALANFVSSGTRAIVPSLLMISQITPDG